LQDNFKYCLKANGNIRYKAQEDKYRPVFCSKGYSKRSDARGIERMTRWVSEYTLLT
jgi:hypothetical protein